MRKSMVQDAANRKNMGKLIFQDVEKNIKSSHLSNVCSPLARRANKTEDSNFLHFG